MARSEGARDLGALVPLSTELLSGPWLEPFVVRRLLSRTPKHLRAGGPKPNPFLPWEPALEVTVLGSSHVVILNKYPVQPGHLLLITQHWHPQCGWLGPEDWQAVAQLASDTDGLWFFNSSVASGASQPHRHLQLLPRHWGELSCPLDPWFEQQLDGLTGRWPWSYAVSRRTDPHNHSDLAGLYQAHQQELGLGEISFTSQPLHAYNLLFNDRWFVTIRRQREHCAGFSLNALAYAGFLLATDSSDLGWLEQHGPWALLQQVAAPKQAD